MSKKKFFCTQKSGILIRDIDSKNRTETIYAPP